MNTIVSTQLKNGLHVLFEPNDSVASVGVRWLLPVGSAYDPPERIGLSTLLSELIFRGAGSLSSREHSDAFDRLGVRRSSLLQTHHLRVDATFLADRWPQALDLIVPMALEPTLPESELEPTRRLSLQSLESLEDEPQQQVMLRLRDRHVASPFNRDGYGHADVLEQADIQTLQAHWQRYACPQGSILGVAGNIDPDQFIKQLESLIESWEGHADEPAKSEPAQRGTQTIEQATAQVHIGVAFDAPSESDEEAMLERLAIGVLSGSSSGRLFTEVRQKRSLCYSVGASYGGGRDWGIVSLYAGTTPERAQETLDVSLGEIQRLCEGVEADEFNRVVTGLKSQLIMQGESVPARASAIVHDFFRLGRARSLEEIATQVDAITLDQLNAYLARREFGEFTIVSLGPVELKTPSLMA
ncbi:MAG: pitrilysin family protein [Planctomycetota bacterium]|nr:pitrilysin family protein [Planctomycetota bacterium]